MQLFSLKGPITSVGILHICNPLDSPEKNCDISCWPKISSSQTFLLSKLTEVTSTQESVNMKTLYRYSVSVVEGRYTWRHDSVLYTLL